MHVNFTSINYLRKIQVETRKLIIHSLTHESVEKLSPRLSSTSNLELGASVTLSRISSQRCFYSCLNGSNVTIRHLAAINSTNPDFNINTNLSATDIGLGYIKTKIIEDRGQTRKQTCREKKRVLERGRGM